MRRTFAGDLIASGVDLYVVSEMLGHRSIQIAEACYARLRREVLDTVRAILNSGTTGAIVTPLHAAA